MVIADTRVLLHTFGFGDRPEGARGMETIWVFGILREVHPLLSVQRLLLNTDVNHSEEESHARGPLSGEHVFLMH